MSIVFVDMILAFTARVNAIQESAGQAWVEYGLSRARMRAGTHDMHFPTDVDQRAGLAIALEPDTDRQPDR